MAETFRMMSLALIGVVAIAMTGCGSSHRNDATVQSQWQRPLDESAIFDRIAAQLAGANASRDALIRALDITHDWLLSDDEVSARLAAHGVSDRRIQATLNALDQVIAETYPAEFATVLRERFELWEVKAAREGVLFTAYFAPELDGSLTQDHDHRFPLYALPADPKHRSTTREKIENMGLLTGSEVVWLRDRFDAYVVHVNGSARVRLPGGRHVNVAHVATNDLPYTSLGKLLISDGKLDAATISLHAIRAYFESHPEEWQHYAWQNDRFVFFELLDDDHWPRSGAGMTLTPGHSLAVDPDVYPLGIPVFVQTTMGNLEFEQVMITQDIGGAIKGAKRADIYIGVGEEAGIVAGKQNSQGRLLMMLLKE